MSSVKWPVYERINSQNFASHSTADAPSATSRGILGKIFVNLNQFKLRRISPRIPLEVADRASVVKWEAKILRINSVIHGPLQRNPKIFISYQG